MRRARMIGAATMAVAVTAAACSSSGDEDAAVTSSPPTTSVDTTTAPTTSAPTTTSTTTTSTTTTTTTTTPQQQQNQQNQQKERMPPVRRMPLTGRLLTGDAQPPPRPALVVKIDNNPNARPQAGLNRADIVFEEIVEYGTRFAAVYHSTEADPVGPIRSGRTQDIDMLGRLNRPLFAWSGGNANVVGAISESPLVSLMHGSAGGFWRSDARSAPHNLYNSTQSLWTQTPGNWEQPSQMFSYLMPGTTFQGARAAGVDVQLDDDHVAWRYHRDSKLYRRFTNGEPHNDEGQRVTTANVVILGTRYRPSWADARSPEAETIGKGAAWVFSRGRMVQGRWLRAGPNAPFRLITGTGENGRMIRLVPGRTHVELADVGVDGQPTPLRP